MNIVDYLNTYNIGWSIQRDYLYHTDNQIYNIYMITNTTLNKLDFKKIQSNIKLKYYLLYAVYYTHLDYYNYVLDVGIRLK